MIACAIMIAAFCMSVGKICLLCYGEYIMIAEAKNPAPVVNTIMIVAGSLSALWI